MHHKRRASAMPGRLSFVCLRHRSRFMRCSSA